MFDKAFLLAGAVSLVLSSNSEVSLEEADHFALGSHLPGMVALEEIPKQVDLRLTHMEGEGFALIQSGTWVAWQEHWEGHLSPDLPHLMYGMARQEWLNRGLFVIHSACVGNGEDGFVLLVGQAGSGKTSTALECVRRHGLKIFSGDKSVIEVDEDGGMWVIGGTKIMTSRAPEKGRWKEMVNRVVPRGNRQAFRLKEEHYSQVQRAPVKGVVWLSLNEGRDQTENFSPVSAVHNLYPFFLDSQKEDVLLNGGTFVFDGSVKEGVKPENVPRLAKAVKKVSALRVVGSMDYVTDVVAQFFKKGGRA